MIHNVLAGLIYISAEIDTFLERILKQRAAQIREQQRPEGRSPVARTCRAGLRAQSSSARALSLGPARGLASDLLKYFQLRSIYLQDLQFWRHH